MKLIWRFDRIYWENIRINLAIALKKILNFDFYWSAKLKQLFLIKISTLIENDLLVQDFLI